MGSEGDVKWSQETYTIQQVVDSSLPTVVKVAEGYYSAESEAESFSNGDLIKLEQKKTYSKVRAQLVGKLPKVDEEGYLDPDNILIPLGYKGKVKVDCPEHAFYCMEDLIKYFPRYVTVCRPIVGKKSTYSDEEVQIKNGTILELDRILPGAGLVVKLDTSELLLPQKQLVRFSLKEDDSQYTISEVVNRFKLPQYVRFLDADFQRVMTSDLTEAIENISHFQGYIKILGIIQQEVVLGHHKPDPALLPSNTKFCQRSIAILPLDSDAIQNIDVHLPEYDDDSDYEHYELLVARNFSNNLNMDVVEGGLYLEFQKRPKVHLLACEEEDIPPPRPPPPNTNQSSGYTLRKPPPIPTLQPPMPTLQIGSPKTTKKTKSPNVTRGPQFFPAKKDAIPVYKDKSPVNKPGPPSPFNGTRQKHIPPIPKSKKTPLQVQGPSSSDSEEDYEQMQRPTIPALAAKKSPAIKRAAPVTQVKPIQITKVVVDDESDDEPKDIYDEIDEGEIYEVKEFSKKTGLDFGKFPKTFRDGLRKVHTEIRKIGRSRKSMELKSTDIKKQDLEGEEYDYPDLTKLIKQPKPKQEGPRYVEPVHRKQTGNQKPIGKIAPSPRDQKTFISFTEMSSLQLVRLLKETNLNSLADICHKESFDGNFISSCSETELKTMFKLNDIQLIKLKKMIETGWRPNTGK